LVLTRALWRGFLFQRSVITSYRSEMDFKMETPRLETGKSLDLAYFDASPGDPTLGAGAVRGGFLFPNEQKGGHLTR
jgi:hypothetical protein